MCEAICFWILNVWNGTCEPGNCDIRAAGEVRTVALTATLPMTLSNFILSSGVDRAYGS